MDRFGLFAEDLLDVEENEQLIFELDQPVEILVSKTGDGRRRRSDLIVGYAKN